MKRGSKQGDCLYQVRPGRCWCSDPSDPIWGGITCTSSDGGVGGGGKSFLCSGGRGPGNARGSPVGTGWGGQVGGALLLLRSSGLVSLCTGTFGDCLCGRYGLGELMLRKPSFVAVICPDVTFPEFRYRRSTFLVYCICLQKASWGTQKGPPRNEYGFSLHSSPSSRPWVSGLGFACF